MDSPAKWDVLHHMYTPPAFIEQFVNVQLCGFFLKGQAGELDWRAKNGRVKCISLLTDAAARYTCPFKESPAGGGLPYQHHKGFPLHKCFVKSEQNFLIAIIFTCA